MQRACFPSADRASQVLPQIPARPGGRAGKAVGGAVSSLAGPPEPLAPQPPLGGRRGSDWSVRRPDPRPAADAGRAAYRHSLSEKHPRGADRDALYQPAHHRAALPARLWVWTAAAAGRASAGYRKLRDGLGLGARARQAAGGRPPRPRPDARAGRLRGDQPRLARLGGLRVAGARAAPKGKSVTHEEFVAAYEAGRIRVQVDREAAARFVAGRAMLPLVLLPIMGLGVALAIVGYLWTGGAIFLAALLLRFLVKRSSEGFLLWRALRDPEFYRQVAAAQVLLIEDSSTPSRNS